MKQLIRVVLGLAGMKSKVLVCISLALIAGCGSSSGYQDVSAADEIVAAVKKGDVGNVLSVMRGHKTVYSQTISNAIISEARVEDQRLDFDGDGQREVLIYLWEGQNSGDRILVFGERNGKWSQWMDVYRPNFESKFVQIDNLDVLQLIDPDNGKIKTVTCAP